MFVGMPFALFVLNVFIGAVSGWIVGLFFGNTILGILDQIGINGFSMWQIGAFLGFISGFFRKMISFNNNKSTPQKQETNQEVKQETKGNTKKSAVKF